MYTMQTGADASLQTARVGGGGVRRRRVLVLLVLFAVAMLGSLVRPYDGFALTCKKLTAQPNADSGSEVLGGEETRLTLELQCEANERLSRLAVELPDGTAFGTDHLRVTKLSGEDLMDREFLKPEVSSSGQLLTLEFHDALPVSSYVRLEIYGVVFPAKGGDMSCKVSATMQDGSAVEAAGVPAVSVAGTGPVEALCRFLEGQDWVRAWNSNSFLSLFFNPVIIVSSVPVIFSGFLAAIAIVALAFPLAVPCGFLLALMRRTRIWPLRALASAYVNLIRGTPAFLQIYIAFFGLPLAGVRIGNYPLGVIVMAMNSSAYLCEIFRAGINGVPKGQSEASRSLGMSAFQSMLYIIIPQTFRNVIPTLASEFILLFKDTSLLAAVGVMEIVMYAKSIVATTGSITPYVVAALFYLLLTLPFARLVSKLEECMSTSKRRRAQGADEVSSVPSPDQYASGM